MMVNLVIVSSIACSAMAQVMLKIGMGRVVISEISLASLARLFSNPFILAGLSLYVTAMLIWLYVLKQVEVSYAYPFTALGFVLVTAVGYFFLAEQITPVRLVGLGLIIAGIFLVAKSA